MRTWKHWALVILVPALTVVLLAMAGDTPTPTTDPAMSPDSDTDESGSPIILTRIYDVADLLFSRDRPIPETISTVARSKAHIPPDYSSGSGSGGVSGSLSPVPAPEPKRTPVEEVAFIVTTMVDRYSWEPDGVLGSIRTRGDSLIIAQTPSNHKKIANLLADLRRERRDMLLIDARWLLLDADQVKAIGGDGAAGCEVDLSKLKAPPEECYRGSISCFDHQTVHLAAGQAKTYLVGAVPIVSDNACAMQPMVEKIHDGILLEVKPLLSPQGDRVTLDLYADLSQPQETGKIPVLAFSGAGAAPPAVMKLDRLNFQSVSFNTTVRIPLGKPVLVAAVSAPQRGQGKQLCLIMQVTADKQGGGK